MSLKIQTFRPKDDFFNKIADRYSAAPQKYYAMLAARNIEKADDVDTLKNKNETTQNLLSKIYAEPARFHDIISENVEDIHKYKINIDELRKEFRQQLNADLTNTTLREMANTATATDANIALLGNTLNTIGVDLQNTRNDLAARSLQFGNVFNTRIDDLVREVNTSMTDLMKLTAVSSGERDAKFKEIVNRLDDIIKMKGAVAATVVAPLPKTPPIPAPRTTPPPVSTPTPSVRRVLLPPLSSATTSAPPLTSAPTVSLPLTSAPTVSLPLTSASVPTFVPPPIPSSPTKLPVTPSPFSPTSNPYLSMITRSTAPAATPIKQPSPPPTPMDEVSKFLDELDKLANPPPAPKLRESKTPPPESFATLLATAKPLKPLPVPSVELSTTPPVEIDQILNGRAASKKVIDWLKDNNIRDENTIMAAVSSSNWGVGGNTIEQTLSKYPIDKIKDIRAKAYALRNDKSIPPDVAEKLQPMKTLKRYDAYIERIEGVAGPSAPKTGKGLRPPALLEPQGLRPPAREAGMNKVKGTVIKPTKLFDTAKMNEIHKIINELDSLDDIAETLETISDKLTTNEKTFLLRRLQNGGRLKKVKIVDAVLPHDISFYV